MKALTLKQPWASLVADGHKTIETRSWATKYRGPLIVHAAAKRPPTHVHSDVNDDLPPAIDLVSMSRYWRWDEHPDDPQHGGVYRWVGPLGAIVATAQLVDCVPMVDSEHPDMAFDRSVLAITPSGQLVLADSTVRAWHWRKVNDQLPFGIYAPARWAWLLADIKPTTERCPACWGWTGEIYSTAPPNLEAPGFTPTVRIPCLTCDGVGCCDPIPAKGRERLWNWDPAVRSGTGSAD